MRHLAAVLSTALLLSACGKKEEPPPPPPPFAPFELAVSENKADTLKLETTGEAVLKLEGSAVGAQWGKKEAEAIAVRITVNNRLTRDLLWITGDAPFTASVALGKLDAGEHNVKVEFVPALSRIEADAKLKISAISIVPHEDQAMARHAPIILPRDDANYNDTPLLVYGTKTATGYRYTVVHSNEDGGTGLNPRLLMALWARYADIEWAYEVDVDSTGAATAARFQAREHKTTAFAGPKEGDHPILRVDGVNGLFSDDGAAGSYTLAPAVIPFDDTKQPREHILDANPWIYPLLDGEGVREGKLDATCSDPMKAWTSDCYVYVDTSAKFTTDITDKRMWGIGGRMMPTGSVPSELDLGLAGRLDREGPVRVAFPISKTATLNAVYAYVVPTDTSKPLLFTLTNVRGLRLDKGVATELFNKTVNVNLSQVTTEASFWIAP